MVSASRRIGSCLFFFFFFNDTATTEIYTLSLHDALPIYVGDQHAIFPAAFLDREPVRHRSEEHTSELQSLRHLVCRLLLEKKKQNVKSLGTFIRHALREIRHNSVSVR